MLRLSLVTYLLSQLKLYRQLQIPYGKVVLEANRCESVKMTPVHLQSFHCYHLLNWLIPFIKYLTKDSNPNPIYLNYEKHIPTCDVKCKV